MESEEKYIDFDDVPVRALRPKTRSKLCCMLNGIKVLPSPSGLPRDWRGIAHYANISVLSIGFSDVNATDKILSIWEKNGDSTVGKLRRFLQEIDRYDVLDDTFCMMKEDALFYHKILENGFIEQPLISADDERNLLTVDDIRRFQKGLEPQVYDAFVLFVESDVSFASDLIQKLEQNYSLKLCVKDRDLIGGLSFEHEAVMRLIAERCNRLIVILSAEFLESDAHKFFVNFAQAVGIEKNKRKVVPCLYKKCALPPQLSSYFLLDYNRTNELWNFWDKLRDSVVPVKSFSDQPSSIAALPPPPDDCLKKRNGIVITEPEKSSTELVEDQKFASDYPPQGFSKSIPEQKSSMFSKFTQRKYLTQIFKSKKKSKQKPLSL